MKLRDRPEMIQMGVFLWPPEWGGNQPSDAASAEEGILKDVRNFDSPGEGHLTITKELNGKQFHGTLALLDVAFREMVFKLLKQNTGKSIREAGGLDTEFKGGVRSVVR